MEDWAAQIAKEFKARNNFNTLGPIIGTVVTPPPALKVSILEGQVFITEIYVLDSVLTEYTRTITMPIEGTEGELTIQEYDAKREDKKLFPPKDYKINIFEVKEKQIVTKDTLKTGDKVLLISSQDNQMYFCLGRVTRLGDG